MAELVLIARCPVHGLHGDRHFCYACGGPVERVPMLPVTREEIGLLIDGVARMVDATHREAAPLLHKLQAAYREAKPA
ncbi:MAG: hypothetical protein ACJ79H_21715 [Myxococcales bacterium]